MAKLGRDYLIICISTYPECLAQLDSDVETLKKLGVRRANRSLLIRYALEKLDLKEAADALEEKSF